MSLCPHARPAGTEKCKSGAPKRDFASNGAKPGPAKAIRISARVIAGGRRRSHLSARPLSADRPMVLEPHSPRPRHQETGQGSRLCRFAAGGRHQGQRGMVRRDLRSAGGCCPGERRVSSFESPSLVPPDHPVIISEPMEPTGVLCARARRDYLAFWKVGVKKNRDRTKIANLRRE